MHLLYYYSYRSFFLSSPLPDADVLALAGQMGPSSIVERPHRVYRAPEEVLVAAVRGQVVVIARVLGYLSGKPDKIESVGFYSITILSVNVPFFCCSP